MSALSLTPTTLLEAVNRMLSTIGEAPVNSLNTNGLGDVALAMACIQDAARMVQERGWNFNTDEGVNLVPDVNGIIWVPANALRVHQEPYQGIRAVQRQGKLWDKDNLTFQWTVSTLTFRVVWMFDFEDLPECFRKYICIKAGRAFQEQAVASQVIETFTVKEELESLAYCNDYDTATQDCNMIYGNASTAMMVVRDDVTWVI